ncbi:hypothetical protein K469DRAFT_606836 [Zopfia rhizophila CBS 207.26]|uniref:Zn(2)-C6 fungal-type domain-containing protein n=1 Tax=Zopfia rhizophila CBS 207.26 TaxID=1314779 RepID=A0A6A6DAN1_9PEZI|nr:hypothetical protein K469DRAFT_606836 [Zopfia rhizophila CBS 207.26]
MTDTDVAPKRSTKRRVKGRSGCTTCRKRKIKCDENKPSCQKCITTGRTCDGYESPFILFTSESLEKASAGSILSSWASNTALSASRAVTPQHIDLLNGYLSIKSIGGAEILCKEESKPILQAGVTCPIIRHAMLSLKAFRADLEAVVDDPASDARPTPTYHFGLEQYSITLRGLASNLLAPGANLSSSPLLCCQILISIEQARMNYVAMAHHILGGLKIMHEHRARPYFIAPSVLAPANHVQLPLLDVFIVKMFAAPCKFADSPTTNSVIGVTDSSSDRSKSPNDKPPTSQDFRKIAPNMRTELTKIAGSTLAFLNKVAQVRCAEVALELLSEKAVLLDSLESCTISREREYSSPEPISVYFMRLFHQTLKVVLLGALQVESCQNYMATMQTENNRLQNIAHTVNERVKGYTISRSSNDQGKR